MVPERPPYERLSGAAGTATGPPDSSGLTGSRWAKTASAERRDNVGQTPERRIHRYRNTDGTRRSVLGHKPPAEFEAELKAGCANATPGRSAVTQLAFLTDGAQSRAASP